MEENTVAQPKPKNSGSKKGLVLLMIALIIVVVVGVVLVRRHSTQQPKVTAPAAVTVEMGEGGFSPQALSIKVGTTVVFKNSGAEPHHVISDPHPDHNQLPDFDSKTNIGPDGTYTYTFNKVGTFHYHNELEPEDGGTVIVSQ